MQTQLLDLSFLPNLSFLTPPTSKDGLIGDGPSRVDFSAFTPQLQWKPTASNNSKGATMNWVEEVAVTLAGGDPKEDPYKTMNNWYTLNTLAISEAGGTWADELQVGSFAVVVDVKTRKNPATTGNYKPPGALGWGYLHPPVIMQQAASTGSAGLTPGGTDAASKTAYDPFAPWYTSDKDGSEAGTTGGYGTITDFAAKLNAYCTPGFSTEAAGGSETGFEGCCQDVITQGSTGYATYKVYNTYASSTDTFVNANAYPTNSVSTDNSYGFCPKVTTQDDFDYSSTGKIYACMPVTWTKWTSYKCGYATGNTSVDNCDAKWLAFGKTGQVSGTDAHNSFVSNGEGGQRLWDGTNSYTGSRNYACSATTAFWNQRKASQTAQTAGDWNNAATGGDVKNASTFNTCHFNAYHDYSQNDMYKSSVVTTAVTGSAQTTSKRSPAGQSTIFFDTAWAQTQTSLEYHIPQVGEAGDWIGVYVANASNNKYKPYAIRAANAVTKSPLIDYSSANGKVINSGLYKFVADSWESVWPEVKEADFKSPSITSVAALSSSTTPVKWVKGPNCGGGKWLSPMACYGIWKPWAAGPSVEPSSTKGGSFQMFHWLADKNPKDPSLVFQIEADATVTLLVNEHIGPWPEDINLRVGDGFKRTYASTAPYATTGTTWYDAPGTDAADNGYSLICKGASGALNSFDAMDYWGYGYFTFEAASGLLSTTAFAATLAALTLF